MFSLNYVGDDLVIKLDDNVKLVSTAINGGLRRNIKYVIIHKVPLDFNESAETEISKVCKAHNVDVDECLVLLTAVNPREATIHNVHETVDLTVIVTLGLMNMVGIIDGNVHSRVESNLGTINLIIIINDEICDYGLVELVKTVTEAKVATLYDHDVRFGLVRAIGTSTDSITIICRDGCKIKYAGPITMIGRLVIRAVYEALSRALSNLGYSKSRSMIKRLEELGLSVDDLVDTALKLFMTWSDVSEEKVRIELKNTLNKILNNFNIASLLLAFIRLEEDGVRGLIPGLNLNDFKRDIAGLVADEVLGIALATYINGWNGLFEYYRYDRKKPGVISRLGPFLDDAVAALIGGVTSRIYSKYCE